MSISPRPHAFSDDLVFESRTSPMRRDSDWGGHPRSHEEDLSWAAKRAAVSMGAATIHAATGGTGSHSDDVVHLCDAIAQELGVHGHDRAELLAAAQLHDIGKVAIPHELLEKPSELDERERALIREHTVAGQKIVRSVPELDDVARIVRHSHERWDGGGYPDGLAGENIPLASRIVFCADAFHAIRSDRPYRRGRAAAYALDEVKANAGTQFDPEVAEALVKCAAHLRSTVGRGGGGGGGGAPVAATLRSRRLLSLLLTLAIGGSALAAGGSYVLREDSDEEKKKLAPMTLSPADAVETAARGRGKRPSVAREGAARGDVSSPPPARDFPLPDPSTRWSKDAQRGRQVFEAGAAKPSPPTPARHRGRRSATRGRSAEAPGRPAQPGRPVGGAPGRSEEAPGRRAQPLRPNRAPRIALPGWLGAEPPGRAKPR